MKIINTLKLALCFALHSATASENHSDYVFDETLVTKNRIEQSGPVPLVLDQKSKTDNIQYLMAAGGARNDAQKVVWHDKKFYPKHAWMNTFDRLTDWYQWEVYAEEAAGYHIDALIYTTALNEGFRISVVETGEKIDFTKAQTGWEKYDVGVLSLPKGKSTLRMIRTTAQKNAHFKSLELVRNSDYPALLKRIDEYQTDTTWMSKSGYGLMFQAGAWGYPKPLNPPLPRGQVERKSLEEYANDFDLPAFVEMVKGTGASYVIWSITWCEYLMCAPIKSVDRYLGHSENTSTRDLIGEMADALKKEGIKFMLYYHRGEIHQVPWFQGEDYPHEEFSKRGTGDRSVFFDSWVEIITEIGERYGDRVDGWFIDGGFVYYPAPYERMGQAMRAGNPNRITSWNSWYIVKYTDFQDASFGEGSRGGRGPHSAGPNSDGRYISGQYKGLLQHGMFEMENAWGVKQPNQYIKTKITPEQGVKIVTNARTNSAPVSFNMMMYEDGSVSEDSLKVFEAIKAAGLGRENYPIE